MTIELQLPLDLLPQHALAPAGRSEGRGPARLRRLSKRLLDIIVAASALIILSPLFLVLMILLRLDGGTAFYVQTRIGRGGTRFPCFKLRTMRPGADTALDAMLDADADAATEWSDRFKLKDDPRVTAIGRVLRATSLDELPQLANIQRGDMSLVGPRPIVDREIERYGDEFALYRRVRPGLTGLWQVSGRNDLPYEDRVRLDAAYVQGWTLRGDLWILLKTVPVVIRGAGAY